MNATEGLMRIAMVVRWLGYLAAAGVIVMAAFIVDRDSGAQVFIGVLVMAVLFAASGWVLAWIIEGFAKPKA